MSKNYLAHNTLKRSLGTAVLVVGLVVTPINPVYALSVPDDIIPNTTQPSAAIDEFSVEEPSAEAILPVTEEVIANDSTPLVTVPHEQPVLVSPAQTDPLVSLPVLPVALPVGISPVVRPSVAAEVTTQPASTVINLQGRVQPVAVVTSKNQQTKPVTVAQASVISSARPAFQNTTALAVGVADTIGIVAGDFLGDPRQSSADYSSNQISPEVAKQYYYGALALGGSGILLYGMSLLSRSRFALSSLTRGFSIR